MSKNPVKIHMTVRDWAQSNHATEVPAESIILATKNFANYGAHSVQCAGGTFGQLLIKNGWEPYEFVGKLTDHYKTSEKTMLWRNEVGLSITRQAPDVLAHLMLRHAELGVNVVDNFHHGNDINMMRLMPQLAQHSRDQGHDIRVRGGIVIQSNPDSMIKRQEHIDRILRFADDLKQSGHVGIYLKNANGVLYPDHLHDVVSALKQNSDQEVFFHTHNTYGYGYQNALAAIDAGIDGVDAVPFALAEGVGQISVEKLMFQMEKQGMHDRMPLVNREAISEDAGAAFIVRALHSGHEVAYDKEFLRVAEMAGTAGGAITSLPKIPQVFNNVGAALGIKEPKKIQMAIYERKAQNREALGYPTNVTPAENIQDMQAATELAAGRTLDTMMIHPNTADLLNGRLGKATDDADPALMQRVLEQSKLDAVLPYKPLSNEMDNIKGGLLRAQIENPSDDQASYMAMAGASGFDFIMASQSGNLPAPDALRVKVPISVMDAVSEGGALEKYAPILFAVAYTALDVHKTREGHYKGLDYNNVSDRAPKLKIVPELLAKAQAKFETVDMSALADDMEERMKVRLQEVVAQMQADGVDPSVASKANRMMRQLAIQLGVPTDAAPHLPAATYGAPAKDAVLSDAERSARFAETMRGDGVPSSSISKMWGEAKGVEAKPPKAQPSAADAEVDIDTYDLGQVQHDLDDDAPRLVH